MLVDQVLFTALRLQSPAGQGSLVSITGNKSLARASPSKTEFSEGRLKLSQGFLTQDSVTVNQAAVVVTSHQNQVA